MKTRIFTEAQRRALREGKAPIMVTVPSLLLYLKRQREDLSVGMMSLNKTQRAQREHTIRVIEGMMKTINHFSEAGKHASLTFVKP